MKMQFVAGSLELAVLSCAFVYKKIQSLLGHADALHSAVCLCFIQISKPETPENTRN